MFSSDGRMHPDISAQPQSRDMDTTFESSYVEYTRMLFMLSPPMTESRDVNVVCEEMIAAIMLERDSSACGVELMLLSS
jgi:hypothetical protein